MVINNKQLDELIKIENKLAKVKKYYNDFCVLCTIIEDLIQQKLKANKKNYDRIKEKRKSNPNYARPKKGGF